MLCLNLVQRFKVQGSRFKVQGCGGGFAAFFIGRCPKVAFSHKLPVTSHFYDTREGIVSYVWHEILRLSPHLFWLRLFSNRAFSSAQDDDTGKRMGSHFGDTLRVLELAVLYYDTSRPLETEVPQRDFRVWPNPKRRLACPLRRLPVRPNGPRRRRRMDMPRRGILLRSGMKDDVRQSVFRACHPDRSGGIFLADW